jgi:hypothetical protein
LEFENVLKTQKERRRREKCARNEGVKMLSQAGGKEKHKFGSNKRGEKNLYLTVTK